MDLLELQKLFKYIENKYNVTEWTIDDIHVWPLIQYSMLGSLNKNRLVHSEKIVFGKFFKKIFTGLRLLGKVLSYSVIDPKGNDNSKKGEIIFCCSSNRTFRTKNGKYYNMLIDPYIDLCKKSGYETSFFEGSPSIRCPRYSKSILINFECRFLNMINFFKRKTWNIAVSDYEIFLKDMRERGIECIPSLEDICRQVCYIGTVKEYLKKRINKNCVKLGICSTSHPLESRGFILACRELDVPTIEIQHGAIGEANFLYRNCICPEGYELLPEYFWCWNQISANIIGSWAEHTNGKHRTVVGGNLWHNLWLDDKNYLVEDAVHWLRCFKERKGISENRKLILLTLNPALELGENINILYSIIEQKEKEYFWIVRFHPDMHCYHDLQNIKKKWGSFKNVYIDEGNSIPLLLWLKDVNLHITFNSTVVIEAAFFGVNSIILDNSGISEFHYHKNEIEQGYAYVLKDENTLLEWIEGLSVRKAVNMPVVNIDPMMILEGIINRKI